MPDGTPPRGSRSWLAMKYNPIWRIRLLSIGLVVVAGLFFLKLFYLQVVRSEDYATQADRQYLIPTSAIFDRGTIFFSNKDGSVFSAATTRQGFKIQINTGLVENPEVLYQTLSAVTPIDRNTFILKVVGHPNTYQDIASHLSEGVAVKIKNLDLTGVSVVKEKWRFYPGGSMAAHTIGLMAYAGDDYTGRYGLELAYNNLLSRSGAPSFAEFFARLFLDLGGDLFREASGREGDLILTIEPTVQNTLEKSLKAVADTYRVESAGGIIMDPKTGEIYALAAWPTFHPGEKQDNINVLDNPLVERVFEMGSIIKPLTMVAALDAGAVTSETTYYDAGTVKVGIATISNYDGKARGTVSMQEVLNQSLNTGAVFAMQQLGRDRFRQYMLDFGIGEETGVELPNEISGLVTNFRSNRDVEYATTAFGQGFAITPLETVRALSALGNNGYLPPPHLIKEIKYVSGSTWSPAYPFGRRVIKGETSEEITRMLVKAVDEALAGGTVKLPHYRVAAKTGTAQIANPAGGGYYDDRYLHSFFGYFPAYDPEFIIFLYIVYPKDVRYASETLTTPFFDLTKFLISYYNIPPDR